MLIYVTFKYVYALCDIPLQREIIKYYDYYITNILKNNILFLKSGCGAGP